MKKIIVLAAAAASVLAISSCSKEILPASESAKGEVNLIEKTFTAGAETTKANTDGVNITWAAGDCIGVSTGTNVVKFSINSGSGTGTATFTGTIADAAKYFAIYPYNKPGSSDAATMSTSGVFSTRFNDWYSSLKPGSLMYSPAVAVSAGKDDLTFKSIGAILKFTVSETIAPKLKKLEIGSSNGNQKLTGAVTVNLNGENPVVSAATSTLCTIAQTFSAGTYYVAVAPVTLTEGFYMRLSFNNGSDYYCYRGTKCTIALESNKVYDLGSVSDSEEIVLTEFNNGAPSCATTCSFNAVNVYDSTVVAGSKGKCMKYSAKSSGAASGQVSFDLSNSKTDAIKVFAPKIRKAYTRTRIRIYLGELDWYPTVKYSGTTYFRLPSSINGVSLSAYSTKNCTALTDDEVASLKTLWASAIKTDDWNEFEWNMGDWSSSLNWSSNAYLNFYFCTNPKGGSTNIKYGDTFYVDNIRFGESDSARTTLLGI